MLYNKNESACNALLSAVSLGRRFESVHRNSTLPAHEPRLVSAQWTTNLAAVSCRQWFMDLRRLTLMSIHEMLACCWCWTAWWEAASCCFARPCCCGHSEIFHFLSKNENSTDLCIWKPLEMVSVSGIFQNSAVLNDNNCKNFLYKKITNLAVKFQLASFPRENTEAKGFWGLASSYRTLNWATNVDSVSRQECFDWSAKLTRLAPHEHVKMYLPQTGKVVFD